MVQYKDDAKLDSSQVRSRGRGRGGTIAVGGGVGTLLLLFILSQVTGVDLTGLAGGLAQPPMTQTEDGELDPTCATGADVATNRDCRFVAYTNSIQDYWSQTLQGYQPSEVITFTDQVDTGCGTATSAVGPFYCPADQRVYLDTGFFDQLSSQFGARGGDATEAYVIAHEFGHHVQNLLGDLQRGQADRSTGPDSMGVRLELQADCYAGAWMNWADANTTDAIAGFTEDDLSRAVDAAEVIGDDRIQESTQGQVHPETWTHGSSQMRKGWLLEGFRTGDPNACAPLLDPATPTEIG